MPAPTTSADPTRLTGRVREMIQHGRVLAARPLLAALRRSRRRLPNLTN